MPFPASLTETLKHYRLQPYPSVTGLPQPITATSVAHFVWALAWACILLVAFAGWGRATGKLLRSPALPFSVACSVGVASVIFLGGLLNLLSALYAGVLVGFVVVGVLLYFFTRNARPEIYKPQVFFEKAGGFAKILLALAILILVFRAAATVRLATFNTFDDGPAYLVFPHKVLAFHHYAFDPFSDRRVITSLGGAYLLQALVIVATSLAHIGMADRTLGLILLFFAVYDIGTYFSLPPFEVAIMEFLVYLIPMETNNLTFIILPLSLFLAIVWIIFITFSQPEKQYWRCGILAGIVSGGIICIKSTFIPYTGALILLPYAFLFWRKKRWPSVALPACAFLAALVVAFAWMVAMKHESCTLLFPLFGHGVDHASLRAVGATSRFVGTHAIERSFIQGIVLLFLAVVQFVVDHSSTRSRVSLSVLLTAAIAITALNLDSGGDYVWRYNFPQFISAILVFAASGLAVSTLQATSWRNRVIYAVAMASLVGCIFYYDLGGGHLHPFGQTRFEMSDYAGNLHASLSEQALEGPASAREYNAVESILPKDHSAIEAASYPFLFTYGKGHQVFIDDWPGAAGPGNGWPAGGTGQQAADYLIANGITYVIYDYGASAWNAMRGCQVETELQHYSELDHALLVLAIRSYHQFDELRVTHKIIYDDGTIAVIDLRSPVARPTAIIPVWTQATSESEMCSEIVRRYIPQHPSAGSAKADQ